MLNHQPVYKKGAKIYSIYESPNFVKMKVLPFIKGSLKINGTLRTFNSNPLGILYERIKLGLILIAPISILASSTSYCILNRNNFKLIMPVIYNVFGGMLTCFVHISLCWKSDDILRLLNELDSLVNESEYKC